MKKNSALKLFIYETMRKLAVLFAGSILGLLALYLVFCLPTDKMQEHVWRSFPYLEENLMDAGQITGYPASLAGSFTDCLMLEHTIYNNPTHSRLEQVLYMYRGESSDGDGWAPALSLEDYLRGAEQPREVEYSRYWHGYLLILKPLLMLTTLPSIRIAASSLQLLLVGLICMQFGVRRQPFMAASFLFSVPFMYYVTMYSSLSLSICFYILCAALLFQLLFHEKLEAKKLYGIFFLILGMATSYFDFLTYPLVPLGFTLCVFLYLSHDSLLASFRRLIGHSIDWGLGYLGLWTSKWILTDLLVDGNVVIDGLSTILERTGKEENLSFLSVLKLNLSVYSNWGFLLLLFFAALAVIVLLWKKRQSLFKDSAPWLAGIPLFVVALYPFVWVFLTQNHSGQHYMFTCKIFAVSIFAALCGIGKIGSGIQKH